MSTQGWTKMEQTGIYKHPEENKLKVRANPTDPTTGKRIPIEETLTNMTIQEAKQRRRELIAEAKNSGQTKTAKSTVACLAKSFLRKRVDSGRWGELTAQKKKSTLARKILAPIGHVIPTELDRKLVKRWIEWAESQRKSKSPTGEKPLADHYAQASFNNWWKLFKYVIKEAYLQDCVDRRFLDWVKDLPGPQSPVKGRRETRTLSVDELEDFVVAAEAIVPARYAEITTLAYTGMRRGALYGLEWSDLDFEENVIHVRRSFSSGTMRSEPKSFGRPVPMVPRVQDALCRHFERLRVQQNRGLDKGIVFPSNNGKRRYGSSLTKPFRKARNAAGIEQHVSPQVLRRTFNSRLLEQDVDQIVLWSIVGHSSTEMTAWYSDISMSAKWQAVNAVMAGDSVEQSHQPHQAV